MNPTDLPLRDIHLPPVPRWWPLAPGWWIMALLAIAVFGALWWHRRRARQRRSALFVARRELQRFRRAAATTDPQQQVRAVSVLLRRLSMSLYSRRESAGLTGEAWLAFLDLVDSASHSGTDARTCKRSCCDARGRDKIRVQA